MPPNSYALWYALSILAFSSLCQVFKSLSPRTTHRCTLPSPACPKLTICMPLSSSSLLIKEINSAVLSMGTTISTGSCSEKASTAFTNAPLTFQMSAADGITFSAALFAAGSSEAVPVSEVLFCTVSVRGRYASAPPSSASLRMRSAFSRTSVVCPSKVSKI